MTSKIHQPCPCGQSSDAYTDHGTHGKCFSCNKVFHNKRQEAEIDTIKQGTFSFQYVPDRGILAESYRKYQVRTKVLDGGQPLSRDYPYGPDAYKTRLLKDKRFFSEGPIADAGLFGKEIFPAGSAKAVTVTEGEEDAIAVYQMLGSRYPAVSVQSSSSARRDATKDFDYLNSFEKIYLCLDNDPQGQKATKEVASLFNVNKVFYVNLAERKDANEYLIAKEEQLFSKIWWAAKSYKPEGVVSTYDEVDAILDEADNKPSIELPFPKLQRMTGGIRTGEVWLWTARPGTGKTELFRAFEHCVLKATDVDTNIGIIHVEEPKDRFIKGMAGLHLGRLCHIPETAPSKADIKQAYRDVTGKDNRLYLYPHFASNDPDDVLDTIRYLVAGAGCKYVFLDNITMAVTGMRTDDERKALDYLSSQLEMMVTAQDFHLSVISHVNKEGDTRGSMNIINCCHTWVHMERPIEHEVEMVRNTTSLTVRKNRPRSSSGPAGKLLFNPQTYTYREIGEREELPIE